jgi:hypothetical protein
LLKLDYEPYFKLKEEARNSVDDLIAQKKMAMFIYR